MTDKKDLIIHLAIFIFFLMSVFASCSTVFNRQSWNDGMQDGAIRIPEDDLMSFATKLRFHRQDPEALYRQARHFQDIGKHKLALAALEDAILADPKFAEAYNAMGISYDCIQDFKRAVMAYERALVVNPEMADVYNNLGYSYFLQGKLESSIDAFQKAIHQGNQNPKYHNNLALAYAKRGHYAKAFAEFKIAGNEARAHYNIAQIYYQVGEFDKARYHFDEATSIAPDMQLTKTGLAAATALAEIMGDSSNVADNQIPYLVEVDTAGKKKLRYKIASTEPEKNPSENLTDENDIFQSTGELDPRILIADLARPNREKQVEVEVTNGNGVHRMASRVGTYLLSKGLKVTRFTNADHFNFDKTKIYYHDDYLQDAFNVAKHIPGLQNMEKCREFNKKNIKIKVLLGKDLVPYDRLITSQLDNGDHVNHARTL